VIITCADYVVDAPITNKTRVDKGKDRTDSLHVTRDPATSMCSGRSNFDSCADVPTTMTSDLSVLRSILLLLYQSFKELTAVMAGHASRSDSLWVSKRRHRLHTSYVVNRCVE